MEKDRQVKVVSILALIVAVVGLSLGFAAYSNTLVISSLATVKPVDGAFIVGLYSTINTEDKGLEVLGVPSSESVGAAVANITENRTKITGLNAAFTAPGQSVTYEFYAHNTGEYDAYLRSIIFSNVDGANNSQVCTADDGLNDESISAACSGIKLEVTATDVTAGISVTGISGHIVPKGEYEKIIVTISYVDNSALPSGPFSVAFGDIYLDYSTADSTPSEDTPVEG